MMETNDIEVVSKTVAALESPPVEFAAVPVAVAPLVPVVLTPVEKPEPAVATPLDLVGKTVAAAAYNRVLWN